MPAEIDIDDVRRTLLAIPGVLSIHDLHVWALTSDKVSMTVHVVFELGVDSEAAIVPEIRQRLLAGLGISRITAQTELIGRDRSFTNLADSSHWPIVRSRRRQLPGSAVNSRSRP